VVQCGDQAKGTGSMAMCFQNPPVGIVEIYKHRVLVTMKHLRVVVKKARCLEVAVFKHVLEEGRH
jgi:hypothetical protein